MKQLKYIILILSIIGFNLSYSQINTDSKLFKILKEKDSLLFERAFNNCETQLLDELIANDFEFYHDTSGVNESKDAFIKVMKNGICSPNNKTKSRRKLVKGSLEVYPLKNDGEIYGALQNGIHKFYETTNGEEKAGSIAKFSHLWIIENGHWFLKRVLSYDHKNQNATQYKKVNISTNTLNNYVGNYMGTQTNLVTVSQTNGGLHIIAGKMEVDVFPSSETLFYNEQLPLTFEFIQDTNNKTEKIIVRENSKIVEELIKQ